MQDGTLGTSDGSEAAEEDPVQISIGDQIIYQGGQASESQQAQTEPTAPQTSPPTTQPTTETPSTASKVLNVAKKLAIPTAILASGGLGAGIPWLLGAFSKPEVPAFVDTDTNTQYELSIKPGAPK